MLPCLNPIIVYDKHKLRALNKGINEKHYDIISIKEFKEFKNFRKINRQLGNDKTLDELKLKSTYTIPCRKCINCQLNKSQSWAIRNSLESTFYNSDSLLFFTLTYDDLFLERRTLKGDNDKIYYQIPVLFKPHLTNFIKRLRKHFKSHFNIDNIKYYASGEYGSNTFRPHYHILLYGLDKNYIKDLKIEYIKDENNYYSSDTILKLWNKGHIIISDFSIYTAAYVSRYCTKKYSEENLVVYKYNNYRPFNLMSKGIGKKFYDQNKEEIYKNDELIYKIDDLLLKVQPPEYFDRQLKKDNPDFYIQTKYNRKKYMNNITYFDNLLTDKLYAEYLENEEELLKKKLKDRNNN